MNKRWNQDWSASESINFLTGLSHQCALLGGPVSHMLHELVVQEKWLELIDYSFDYDSIEVTDAIYARQIQALFNKQDYIDLGIDVNQAAWLKFLAAEGECLKTNSRLRSPCPERDVSAILFMATQKITEILGDCPSLDQLDFSFGPGATTSTKGELAFPRGKLSSSLECSESLLPVVGDLLAEAPHWAALHSNETDWRKPTFSVPVTVTQGTLSFVPKTAKTRRSIIIEPILNGFYQKGLGKHLKDRLAKHGINLKDQTRNQQLARVGSIDGSLATVDLSSASDTISEALIWQLLPYDWANTLSAGRSETVRLPDDEILRLHKFSSMGNAYTFELESLLFYSLAYAVCKYVSVGTENLSVYGDDIIIPSIAYPTLKKTLVYCGFEINTSKSFCTGPFRESCGADFLSGVDIRPFYQKDLVSERTLYVMHNQFVRNSEYELAAYVRSRCVDPLYGPDGYGDGHLIGSYSIRRNRECRRRGWGGGYFDTYSLKAAKYIRPLPGDYVLPAYSTYVSDGESLQDHDVVRGSRGYHKLSIYTLATSVFRRV